MGEDTAQGDSGKMTFGEVLTYLQTGPNKFARHGWNGKNQYIQLQVPDEQSANTLPYIFMVIGAATPNDKKQRVPWLASQTDMLADDWYSVE